MAVSLAIKVVYSGRRFITLPYRAVTAGRLVADRPRQCPRGDDEDSCKIVCHTHRDRKCGPTFPLSVLRCWTHHVTFTVYPVGWTPYARRPLVRVSFSGDDLSGLEEGREAWCDTAFGASVDAGARRLWPQSAAGHTAYETQFGKTAYGVRRTQRRHCLGINRFMGLSTDAQSEHLSVATLFSIEFSELSMIATNPRDGPRRINGGEKGGDLLSIVGQPRRKLLTGFLKRGADLGYWGESTKC
jgi:hypothetical protein